jgi:hypothetical protein
MQLLKISLWHPASGAVVILLCLFSGAPTLKVTVVHVKKGSELLCRDCTKKLYWGAALGFCFSRYYY